jgi:hypothetical protein
MEVSCGLKTMFMIYNGTYELHGNFAVFHQELKKHIIYRIGYQHRHKDIEKAYFLATDRCLLRNHFPLRHIYNRGSNKQDMVHSSKGSHQKQLDILWITV